MLIFIRSQSFCEHISYFPLKFPKNFNMNNELTQEAKASIRQYILSLVAIPSVILSASMFFLGYFIKDVAAAKAYNDAYQLQFAEISKLRSESDKAKSSAAESKLVAQDAVEELQAANKEAERLLNRIQKLSQSEELRKQLATTILSDHEFSSILRAPLIERIRDSEIENTKLLVKLVQHSDAINDLRRIMREELNQEVISFETVPAVEEIDTNR